MRKIPSMILLCAILMSSTSCATIFGGQVSACQRTRPAAGEPARPIRVGALVLDILIFWPGAIVDFADNAIYKPCADKPAVRK